MPFLGQGRRGFGTRSVRGVREGERREERQACEREADKGPRTPLMDPFDNTRDRLFNNLIKKQDPHTVGKNYKRTCLELGFHSDISWIE